MPKGVTELVEDFKILHPRAYTRIYNKGRADAEAEHKAMCDSCIHKVSAVDINAIRDSAIDEFVEAMRKYWSGLSAMDEIECVAEQLKD